MVLRALVSLALALLTAGPAGAGSYSADGRQNVDEVTYPWSALGRVNNEYGGFCTGTLIGLRSVLTAAHCLRNKRRGGWLRPASLHFVAGYQRGDYLAHARVASYVIGGDIQRLHGGPIAPSRDWAILSLERDIGALVGRLEILPAPAGSRLVQAGYRFDRPHVLSADRSCQVVGSVAQGRLVTHGCAAGHVVRARRSCGVRATTIAWWPCTWPLTVARIRSVWPSRPGRWAVSWNCSSAKISLAGRCLNRSRRRARR
jgi:protease YdgD